VNLLKNTGSVAEEPLVRDCEILSTRYYTTDISTADQISMINCLKTDVLES
jgi:hypothetical protein